MGDAKLFVDDETPGAEVGDILYSGRTRGNGGTFFG